MLQKSRLFLTLDAPSNVSDRWQYGWRYVPNPAKPGEFTRQPLTLEDILHPQEEDIWVSNDLHGRDMRYAHHVAESRLKADEHALVLSDVRIAWDEDALLVHRPDLAIFRGVQKPKQHWATFNIIREGCRPLLLLEITSPSTRLVDRVSKLMEYEAQGVDMYVIADGGTMLHREYPMLLAYRHTGNHFVMVEPDENGRVWLEVLGVSLGWDGDQIAFYLPDGQRIPEYGELESQVGDLADRVTDLADQNADLADRVETTEKERDEAREAAASAREAAKKEQTLREAADQATAAAREEAARFAKRVQELEAMLKPQPPDAA